MPAIIFVSIFITPAYNSNSHLTNVLLTDGQPLQVTGQILAALPRPQPPPRPAPVQGLSPRALQGLSQVVAAGE